ncbi:WD40 repeat-like protein [Serendipita vermifera]|nr:WD40 repeat-like protein [Serendipita vermifera]
MDVSNSSDDGTALYLQQVAIENTAGIKYNLKLQIGSDPIEIQRKPKTAIWTSHRHININQDSRITIIIKEDKLWGRQAATAIFEGNEIFKVFWEKKGFISEPITLGQQAMTIVLSFSPSPTYEAIRAAVDKVLTAMKDYRPLMKSPAQHRIGTTVKYGTALSEINPQAKTAFAIVTATFQLLKEQQKYDSMVSGLAEQIERILPFSKQAFEEIPYEDTELLQGALGKLNNLIMDTAEFICNYVPQHPARRAMKSIISREDQERIKGLQEDFNKLKEDFDRAVNVEALRAARMSEESRHLDRLKPVEASYDPKHGCMPETRKGVLDQITGWALRPLPDGKPPYTSNIYWLYGTPGLGKTTVANSLCSQIHARKQLGASFFCRRDDPVLCEMGYILPTLIYQLAWMWAPYRQLVVRELRKDPQFNPKSSNDELLSGLLANLGEHPLQPFILVIDAFDECGSPQTRKALLKSLTAACAVVPWLRLIITSRPEQDINEFFHTFTAASVQDLAQSEESREDILLFAKVRMRAVAEHRRLPPDWPNNDLMTELVSQSNGLFMFVETIYLRIKDDEDPNELLTELLHDSSRHAMDTLFKLYLSVLESKAIRKREELQEMLGMILAVAPYRSLCDETIAEMLGAKVDVVQNRVNILNSLFYRDTSKGGGIRVRHLSIFEFLTGDSCPIEFRVDIDQASMEVGFLCLRMMTDKLKFNICNLETSLVPNNEVTDLDTRIKENISDGLQYSCIHWASHLILTSKPNMQEKAISLIESLFEGIKPLFWMEVLSLLGQVPVGIPVLRKAITWFRKSQAIDMELMHDSLRFILMFRTAIETSVPHIYLSALPFSPRQSRLWKNGQELVQKLMNVCRGRMDSWPVRDEVWHGHLQSVTCVACSPDGSHVASGSNDGTIRVWDADTGIPVGEPLGKLNAGRISGIAYSPDGESIVSGSRNWTVQVWNIKERRLVGNYKARSPVGCVAYSPDGRSVASGGKDGIIQIWDVYTGTEVRKLSAENAGNVEYVTYSPNSPYIAFATTDKTTIFSPTDIKRLYPLVGICDIKTGNQLRESFKVKGQDQHCVAYSPDGSYIAYGSRGTIQIREAETGNFIREIAGRDKILSIAYTPDGRRVVSGSKKDTVQVWDVQTGNQVGQTFEGHKDEVTSVACSLDGRFVVSGSLDKTLRIWGIQAGYQGSAAPQGHTSKVMSVAYSPNSRYIVSGSADETVRIWEVETGNPVGHPLEGHTDIVRCVAWSPNDQNDQNIASGSDDKTIRIWDTNGNPIGGPLNGKVGAPLSLAYSPDGRYIVSGFKGGSILIWDVEARCLSRKFSQGHDNPVLYVTYSPDGLQVACGSIDGKIRIWSVDQDDPVHVLSAEPRQAVDYIKFSLDGTVLSHDWGNRLRKWAVKEGKMDELLMQKTGVIRGVAYSPDDRYIACGSTQGIAIWDIETGERVHGPFKGHTNMTRTIRYSPDGQSVVSCGEDNTIRIWRVKQPNSIPIPLGVDPSTLSIGDHPLNLKPDLNGWVRTENGGLLFWLPQDCRNGFASPAVMTFPNTGRHRIVRLDLSNFCFGTSWRDIMRK